MSESTATRTSGTSAPPAGVVASLTLDDLRRAATYASPDLECDLIMKGGITSGVVYPRAVCRLAAQYRIKQVGGASAGAIAAAMAAAAEYGRHRAPSPGAKPDTVGFVGLDRIPDEMGTDLAGLFQPQRATRPAFRLLNVWVRPSWSTPHKVLSSACRVIVSAPLLFLVALVIGLVPGTAVTTTAFGGHGLDDTGHVVRVLLVWLPGALVFALLVCSIRLALRTLRGMNRNGFGLCNGRGSRHGRPALTDWMSTTLDHLAGLDPQHGPLTFGDLWGDAAIEVHRRLHARDVAGEQVTPAEWATFRPDIDLKVMTTNLTYRRPYQFPFSSDEFFFCRQCTERYFPDDVVQQMVKASVELSGVHDDPPISPHCPIHHDETVRYLPSAPDMPVIVAARLSLSFPGLISAVPFYAVDRSRRPEHRGLVPVWFSDGGITSNFPMHFFDSMWPVRPTFGIDLQPFPADYPDQRVYRARSVHEGKQLRVHPMTSMPQFASALLDSLQNWSDSLQVTMPGFRNRITEVRTDSHEGGINLQMEKPTVDDLARRGFEAAGEFDDFDLGLHQWIRYRVAMNSLSDTLEQMHEKYIGTASTVPYANLIDELGVVTANYSFPSDVTRAADLEATRKLMDTAQSWLDHDFPATARGVPRPRPQLRQVPPR